MACRGTALEIGRLSDRLCETMLFGAKQEAMPVPVQRLVASGICPPSHFGAAELARYFPAADGWRLLAHAPTTLYGIPLRPGEGPQHIPGYFGVLRWQARS
jgi:hypothetical protein